MSTVTPLSSGSLNGQTITIELVEPVDLPAAILIRWPEKPAVTSPANYDQLAAAAMRLIANASVELAAIKVRKKL